ncbi:MAG: indolepyruvate ferredoxin oxidoreductase subunit alpha [Ruminococcaceae bacterium]|nr:indolepyruvate ferredoxin oxidoreductase subunit alpha [Oscillospiraceae bacterium]
MNQSEKTLLLGNAAVARGLYEAGCSFVSSYPGTPSTEVTEEVANYPEVYAEWAPNEKVALEAAFGASLSGVRSFAGMKHVGLNVAADPLFTMAYTGINGGLVIAVADDMGMHSSQNEQDSRHYAISAKVPMVEPADSEECRSFVKAAYELSERFDTPVLFRLSTRIAHSRSLVALADREDVARREYVKNPQKYVMMPANARGRHVFVEDRMAKLAELAETTGLNKIIPGDKKLGIIASGIAYCYAREALGDNASYLKLGLIHPLSEKLIREFAASVDRLIVIEELDDVFESQIKKMGIACEGKSLFSLLGEYSAELIEKVICGKETSGYDLPAPVPGRPPVLCPGCPHRGVFYVLSKLKLTVSGDIGCYTLGALAPLSALDTTLCMGASISGLHGFVKAGGEEAAKKSVAVIGDSTFIHSGITGLINIVYNQSNATVMILDNSITGMTGHQQNPCTGKTLQNDPTYAVDLEALCKAVGVKRVSVVDPFDIAAVEATVKEELAANEPSVIIARRPCALLKSVKAQPALKVDADKCRRCKACMKIGCPAISFDAEHGAKIDFSLCTGCGLCEKLCKFDAIIG